jgi:hypothetical protein
MNDTLRTAAATLSDLALHGKHPELAEAAKAVRAALAAPGQAPQPVAWVDPSVFASHVAGVAYEFTARTHKLQEYSMPLYAGASPQAVPADWTKAVQEAYGWLWNINNEPLAPIPLLDEGKAAYQARKALRDLLTSEQRAARRGHQRRQGNDRELARSPPAGTAHPRTGHPMTQDTTRAALSDLRAIVQQAAMALEELQGPGFLIGGVMHHRIGLILPKLNAAIDEIAALAQPQQAATTRTWDEFGRTNAGDQTGGAVQRFGFDISGSKPDIIPATNGAFVYYSDYLALHKRLAAAPAGQAAAPEEKPTRADLLAALKWYADGEHFTKADPDAWDTVSGEPQNWWCDEAGTATIEDGTLAGMVLAGKLTGAQLTALEDGEVIPEQAPAAEAVQPIGYLSPKQLPRIVDPEGEFGTYIPMRKTPAGNFTLAVYAQAEAVQPLLAWAVERWQAEVMNRPIVNKNRRPLDDVWRQVVRYAGGNPDELLGPSHDEMHSRMSSADFLAEPGAAQAVRLTDAQVQQLRHDWPALATAEGLIRMAEAAVWAANNLRGE